MQTMVDEHLQRALAFMALRRFEAAREEALRVLAIEPEHPLANLIVGESLLRTNQCAAGREQAARLIGIAPDWCWGYWLLAWCWLEDKSTLFGQANCVEEAAQATRQALAIDPDDPTLHYLAASVALRKGDAPAALQFAEQGLAMAPQSHPLYRLRGQALILLDRRDDASASLEQALELSPDDAPTHRLLAQVSYERGKYDRALEHIGHAMRREPENFRGRDQYLDISPVKFQVLRGLTWIYQATRTWRRWSAVWIVGLVILGVPLNYWVESKLRGHWSAGVVLGGWLLAIAAPVLTLALPVAARFLWVVAGRDPVRRSLTRQERWNRIFPALAILLSPLAILGAYWLRSMIPLEYYLTAIVVAQLQATAALFASRRLRLAGYVAAGLYAALVPLLLIHQLAGPFAMPFPAFVLNTNAIVFTMIFRVAQHSMRRPLRGIAMDRIPGVPSLLLQTGTAGGKAERAACRFANSTLNGQKGEHRTTFLTMPLVIPSWRPTWVPVWRQNFRWRHECVAVGRASEPRQDRCRTIV
jgi:thioredoxin-like negative regulator of GroEL